MSEITVDVTQIEGLAASLAKINLNSINAVTAKAVNDVTQRAFVTARKQMIAGINLPDAYLRDRMSVTLATADQPLAVIRASFQQTLLGKYAPQQLTRPAGPRSKGDRSRGIPAGLKQAGISVEVTRGSRKGLPGAFTMPLKNGNGIGVFIRVGGRAKILYGPAVWQLFRATIDVIKGGILDDLETTAVRGLSKLVQDDLA